jgi:hypothetical protein
MDFVSDQLFDGRRFRVFMPDKFYLMPEPTHGGGDHNNNNCGFGHKVKLAYYWNQ